MKINIQRTLLVLLMLFAFASQAVLLPTLKAQGPSLSVRQRFVVMTAFPRCRPAEVKTVSFGRQPREALLAQVKVESHSSETITAIKLGWKIYDHQEGSKIQSSACDAPPISAEVLLSGTTPLIQVDLLAPKEASTISINPTVLPAKAEKTVFVDRPFITADDVKPLTDRATQATQNQYLILVFVSEVHFNDGTTWNAESI
jgi:hypothetical protein